MSHRSLDIETLRERVSPAFEKIIVRINRIHSYIYNIREFSLGKFHLEFRSFPPYFPRFFPNTFLSFRTMDSTILSSLKFSSSSFFFFCLFLGHPRGIWRFPGQGSNRSCSHLSMSQPQQCQIWAGSATYTSAHGNARS